MSADAFRRLALFALGCLIAGSIVAVGEYVSWLVAGGALAGGVVLALGATTETR